MANLRPGGLRLAGVVLVTSASNSLWCNRGVWGEGPAGAGSPHSCTADYIYVIGAPGGLRSHMKDGGAAGTSRVNDGNHIRIQGKGVLT